MKNITSYRTEAKNERVLLSIVLGGSPKWTGDYMQLKKRSW